MDDAFGRQFLEVLHQNQIAAQQLLESVMHPPALTAGAKPPAKDATAANGNGAGANMAMPVDFASLAQNAQRIVSALQRPSVVLDVFAKVWVEQMRVMIGASDIAPAADDHRFDDVAWRENHYYKALMQSYLSFRRGVDAWVDALPLEHDQAERVRFMATILAESVSPSNWGTNPAALKRYFETGGQSAIHGWQHMVDDAVHNGGMPATVKRDALKIGVDIATTPGKVVYRSDVFELIQYAPSTEDVHTRPFLMVPPQINRFYFYDLSEKKSLIRFAVDSGLQTFTISWRNPTLEQRDWNFDTYIAAIEQAIDVVRDITGSPDVNIEGGCIAGMEVAALLADLAQRGENKVHSATLMVTLLDTGVESQLGVLATPPSLEMAKSVSRLKGVMDGAELGRIFSYLRPNDLIWNYWINNYLLGNDPPSFDVLAWNDDTSRMTAGFHCDLLDLVQHNPLATGEFKVRGKPVRMQAIECDQFWLAGLADHITPWPGCYGSAKLVGGRREFVVSDGGHIQSMISSPANSKAKYFVNDKLPATADAWLEGAVEHRGSWWLRWHEWITRRSGKLQKARATLGNRTHRPLADAPGTYVFE